MAQPLESLEKICRDVGRIIGSAVPKGTGFALLVFDFGEGGHMTYVSNSQRRDMVKALREMITKLEGS